MTTTSAGIEKVDSVQMLRALAAVAVVLHHVPLFGNGAWGVDLFFVISGFIMCYVTAKSGEHFLLKRAIRIIPLYWAGTIAVFAIAAVMPQLLKATQAEPIHLIKSLLFIPFQKGELVQPVLFLGWTLNYEVFFYLLFALSMAISHRWRALICSGLLIGFVIAGGFVDRSSVIASFYTSSILLEFVLGMLCYAIYTQLIHTPVGQTSTAGRLLFFVAGAAAIALMPTVVTYAPEFTLEQRAMYWGPLAAIAFLGVVIGLRGATIPSFLVLLGDASYSLYLFHPYIIQVFIKIFRPFGEPGGYAWFMAVAVVLLCCLLTALCYVLLERPVTVALRNRLIGRQPLRVQPATD